MINTDLSQDFASRDAIDSKQKQLPPFPRSRFLLMASAIAMALSAGAVQAQTAPASSESAMLKLIRGLIQSGALTKDVGEALLAQAQAEALAAKQAQSKPASPPAGRLRAEAGDVRVPYISETTRNQIRDEVKGQVMAQAKAEGWAAPNETPEWTKRIRIEGDVRMRDESRAYASGNSNIEIDWAAINKSSGYDINSNTNVSLPPLLNTRQDRDSILRVRARLGVLADISESTHAGIRVATGNDDSPVSTTQTLGGGLDKKNIWLDQAWLSYKAAEWLEFTGGRFGNPFISSDILYSSDLNFDGIAAQFKKSLDGRDVSLFSTLGIIPLEYSSDNSPSHSQSKMSSENKWLLGAQFGASWKLNANNQLRGALAYYDFQNVSGQRSESCALYAGADGCSTDWSRAAFMQKGNTLMLVRNIALNPLNAANTAQPQYVGLASEFRLFDINLRWDTKVAGGYGLRLDGSYVRNLAYDSDEMWRRSGGEIVNNFDGSGSTTKASFKSGGNAYMLQATLGKPIPVFKGEWNVALGYKYIEPDALPDGYNDSSFHQGGTNARGYILASSYAIDRNTWLTGRWLSSKEVFGAPFSIDTLQLELNAKF